MRDTLAAMRIRVDRPLHLCTEAPGSGDPHFGLVCYRAIASPAVRVTKLDRDLQLSTELVRARGIRALCIGSSVTPR
jgi:hypothetical protein